MESGLGPPQEWIGRQVRVLLQGEPLVATGPGIQAPERVYGVLTNVNEIGVTLEEAPRVGVTEATRTLSFIPWGAIRGIRLEG